MDGDDDDDRRSVKHIMQNTTALCVLLHCEEVSLQH